MTSSPRRPLLANPHAQRIIAPLIVGALLLLLWQGLCVGLNVPVYLVPTPAAIFRTLVADWPLLFGALHAGGTNMEAATQVPSDVVQVLQGLIVLFVAAPPLIKAVFRLRKTRSAGLEAVPKGWNA